MPPDAGEVTVSGRVGYCPQQPGLFDLLSADEHLALFAPALGLSRDAGDPTGATSCSPSSPSRSPSARSRATSRAARARR